VLFCVITLTHKAGRRRRRREVRLSTDTACRCPRQRSAGDCGTIGSSLGGAGRWHSTHGGMAFPTAALYRRIAGGVTVARERSSLQTWRLWQGSSTRGGTPLRRGVGGSIHPGPGLRLDSSEELMLQRIMGAEAARRIPAETARDEIKEGVIVTLQSLPQFFRTWPASSALG
jgi:hypothetical protein